MQEISLIIIIGMAWYKQMVCYDRKGTVNQVKKNDKEKKTFLRKYSRYTKGKQTYKAEAIYPNPLVISSAR